MARRDPRVDAYLANSADFAKPILTHLRGLAHAASPDVEETMKWSVPCFMYKGMLCSMAAFKAHCRFGFWKGRLVLGDALKEGAEGQFGSLTSVADLPSKKVLIGYIRKAMTLNAAGITAPRRAPRPPKKLVVPADLAAALRKSRKAQTTFDAFSPSHKREYVEWVAGAKGEETRQRRAKTAVEWMATGKSRNWKYERT